MNSRNHLQIFEKSLGGVIMVLDEIAKEIAKLSLPDKLQLIKKIEDGIAPNNPVLPLAEWQKAEFSNRYGEYKNENLQLHDGEGVRQNLSIILKETLRLPLEARAALAGSLLDSLDETIDEDAESAWETEILQRLQEIDQGKVNLVPWTTARRQITGE
jgi:putative addiction module component (TIGR02574 family)